MSDDSCSRAEEEQLLQLYKAIEQLSQVEKAIVMLYMEDRTYEEMEEILGMDGLVRSNLEQQLDLLQTRLRWNIVGVRIDAIFLMVLLEVVPYFQHYRMLDKWHSLAPVIRFGSYAGFLVIQYFVSKWVCQLKFGRHIDYLKGLLNEMQH